MYETQYTRTKRNALVGTKFRMQIIFQISE
jgi:hypothetical protein